MGIITPKEVFTAMKEFKDTDGLIIDVRNYPKGSMYALSGRLVHQKKDFCKVLRPDYSYPGKFYWDSGLKTGYKKRGKAYEKPIVVLVNEQTQSHAEFSVMSLQAAEQVTTIGRQTAGADGNICRIQLGDNYKTAFSGIGIFYPDGAITQRSGVHIDQVVERTIAGVKEGKDEVLEVAIQMIVGE
jgi:C-terminal processing protease CtpA/Prc